MKKIFFVLCLLLSLYLCTGCGKNEQVVDNTVYVKTQTIDYGASSNEDNYAGVVKGRYETNLAFQVSGKILSRNINLGDRVSAGDVLMVIDDKDIRQSVNAYDAQVEAAKSQLN